MQKNITAITVSKDDEEKRQQLQEIEASGYRLYGMVHLYNNYCVKEMNSTLRLLKKYGSHMIMLDGMHLADEIIHELSALAKQNGLETLVINHRILNADKRYMFLLCRHAELDIEMLLSLLLKQHTTDLYILIENPISIYQMPIEKLKQAAEILSIGIHFFYEANTE